MAFVKLDCGILTSTTWVKKDVRDMFVTALLMAHPYELLEPAPQIKISELTYTGWEVPPGWYGFVPAASVGICRMASIDRADGLRALEELGGPDEESRSREFDGRRMVRVNGGFIILNYQRYRDKDHTAKERQRRYRLRQKKLQEDEESRRYVTLQDVSVTQVEVEVEVEVKGKKKQGRITPPDAAEVQEYLNGKNITRFTGEDFVNHYASVDWFRGKTKIKSWKHCVATWAKSDKPSKRYGEGSI